MYIDAVASAIPAPQTVDKLALKERQPVQPLTKVAQVEASVKPAEKPVPEAAKIDINTKPLVSSEELAGKIAELNEALVSRNQAVEFSTDSSTGRDVVRVSNRSTGELIRQMPSVEALKAMQNIDQMMGLIFNSKT
ncbi:MAG: flagellar protein FlaG [Oceanospirillaceae bacterium]|jgi:flagellar protein FlaG